MRVMPLERVPPQSIEAEQGVLGSMLLERDAIARVVEMLRGEDFYREAHRRIYDAMVDLFERGEPVDLITVTDRLKARGQLEDVGGAAYVTSLLDAVPTAANVEYYARLVLQKSLLRQLIAAGTEIVGMGFREEQEVEVLLDQAEKLVFGIASRRMAQDFLPIREVLQESFDRIDRRYQDKGTVTGVPTGFVDLDRMTAGLQPADLVIVAARPAMGKCLKYDTEIVDAQTGAVRTIQEVVGARQASLFTLDESMRLSPTAPSHFVDDGIRPVFRVRLASGREVETTLSHPFLTPRGWCALHDLSPGALVAVPRRLPVFGALDLPAHEVRLLAYLTSGRLPVSPLLAADFADAVAVADAIRMGRPAERSRPAGAAISGGSQAAEAVDVLRARYRGLDGPSHARFIPPEVATLRREKLALFLNRLLAACGEIAGEGEILTLEAEMPSPRVARQVQHLLLRFGVPSVVAGTSLRVGPAAMVSLVREVGVFGRERLRRWARNQQRSLLQDVDVMWDTVVAVEEAGSFQVYDLTVPRTHNFIANDVCVHNTTFCLNIAQHAALQQKTPVAIFSLETSSEQVVQRMLAAEAEVDGSKLRTGFLSDSDWPRLAHAMARLSEAPIFIDDSAAINVIEMRAKARKLKAEHGLGLIIIDYLQMIQSYKRTENRTQEISEIARATKSLAKELDVPVIAISQLSRAVEALGNRRPQLSHLRESGELEQVADLVLFIYREDYYNENTEKKNIAEIILSKHRNGPTGTVELYFDKEHSRFVGLDRRRGGPGR
jgi:replicative DNA helicase